MKFKIDLKIFLLIILFLCTNQIKIYGMMMLFAIIHELGHLIAGIILKMKPNQLKINPLGISIEFDIKNRDYNIKIQKANLLEIKKIIVALAGPLTNFIIILILRYINIFSEYDKLIMTYSNALLIVFNILPIYPLDGGRVLKSLIYIYKGKYLAEEYTYNISYIILILLTAISSVTVLWLKNISVFFIIIFLWGLQIKESIKYKNRKKLYELIKYETESYNSQLIK